VNSINSSPHFSQSAETCNADLQIGCSEGLLALRDLAKPLIPFNRAFCEKCRLVVPPVAQNKLGL
jgi:hypothetical protein